MGLWQAPTVTNDMDLKQLKNLVAMLIHDLDFVINGNISSKNVREIGGFQVGDNYLRSKNGLVGMSSAKLGGDLDDVRIWAGHSNPALAPFRVYNSGKAVLSDIEITGGSISWANVNTDPVASGAAATAGSALSIAQQIANGTYTGGTFINGEIIYSPDISGGTITGSTIRTSVSSYPRVELSSTSNILSAQATSDKRVDIWGSLSGDPTLVFQGGANRVMLFYFNSSSFFIDSDTSISIAPRTMLQLGGVQCLIPSWTYLYNQNTNQNLQQVLNSLDARISALE